MPGSGWGGRRNVAPYVGATIVVVIGFWGIMLTGMAISPNTPMEVLLGVSAVLAAVVTLLWCLMPSSEMPSAVYDWVRGRKKADDELKGYEPVTKREKRHKVGPQAPPSVEEVRQAKLSGTSWVPTGHSGALKKVAQSRRLGTNKPPASKLPPEEPPVEPS